MDLEKEDKKSQNQNQSGTVPLHSNAEGFLTCSLWIKSSKEDVSKWNNMERFKSKMTVDVKKIIIPDDYTEIMITDLDNFLALWLSNGSVIYKEQINSKNDTIWVESILDYKNKIIYKFLRKKSNYVNNTVTEDKKEKIIINKE